MYDWEVGDPFFIAWVRMSQATEAVSRAMEIELGKQQATFAQAHVLLVLSLSKNALTPGDLAPYLFREKHSVSALLTRMQRAGYVRKTRIKKDQRVVRVRIQPKGKELLDRAMPIVLRYTRDLLASCFTQQEVKRFDGDLKKLRDRALRELETGATALPDTFDLSNADPSFASL